MLDMDEERKQMETESLFFCHLSIHKGFSRKDVENGRRGTQKKLSSSPSSEPLICLVKGFFTNPCFTHTTTQKHRLNENH